MSNSSRLKGVLFASCAAAIAIWLPSSDRAARAADLVIAQGADAIGFDPTKFATGNHVFLNQLYDTLVELDERGLPQPALAQSWQRSSDGLAITFRLRAAKFHSGRDLTADDVVFTIQRYLTQDVGANLYARMQSITRARAVDPQTVELSLSAPTPGLFDLLSAVYIQDRETIGRLGTQGAGSGPFRLESWTPGDRLVMARHTGHWRNDGTGIDRIIVRIIPDEDSAAAALQTGAVDLLLNAGALTASQLKSERSLKVDLDRFAPRSFYLMANTSKAPLDNQAVRQAIMRAIDRRKIADIVFAGAATPTCQAWAPGHWAHDPSLEQSCAFDLQEAQRLLRASGVRPFAISVNTAVPAYSPGSVETAQILKEDLAKIGITLNIATYEQAKARQLLLASEFDMLLHQYTEGGNDPQFIVPSALMGPGGRAKFTSPAYEALVKASVATVDIAQRKPIYADISKLLIDAAFIMPTVHEFRQFPMKRTVQGFRLDSSGFPVLRSVRIGN